jgi:hypothetical protein
MGQAVTFGSTVTVALLALVFAGLFTGLGHLKAIKWLQYLVLPLVLTGAAGLMHVSIAGYSIGGALAGGFGWLNHVIGLTIPAIAGILATVVGIVAVVVLIHDGWDGKPETRGVVAAVLTPVSVTAIPGPLGAILLAILALPVTAMAALISAAFGLG